MKTLGWFPTKESIDEAVEMVDKDGTGDISFDEFFKLMQHLRKTEGFTKDEIATSVGLLIGIFRSFSYSNDVSANVDLRK